MFIATIICLRVGYEYFKKRKMNANKKMTFSKRDQEWGTLKQVKKMTTKNMTTMDHIEDSNNF